MKSATKYLCIGRDNKDHYNRVLKEDGTYNSTKGGSPMYGFNTMLDAFYYEPNMFMAKISLTGGDSVQDEDNPDKTTSSRMVPFVITNIEEALLAWSEDILKRTKKRYNTYNPITQKLVDNCDLWLDSKKSAVDKAYACLYGCSQVVSESMMDDLLHKHVASCYFINGGSHEDRI